MPPLSTTFQAVRAATEALCAPLEKEDYVVQPVVDVSPPKWHLGHTAWFFETFVLQPHLPGYAPFDPQYNFVFNSYYETIGARVIRTDRGNLSRPSVDDVYRYRRHVDAAMLRLFETVPLDAALHEIILLGLNHEQQHQELLSTDIKYILGHNPLFPAYGRAGSPAPQQTPAADFIEMDAGIYDIGFEGEGFCFDNELGRHRVYLEAFRIAGRPVTNGEYLAFMDAGGYGDFRHWHAEGWEWVREKRPESPLYWHRVDGTWLHYTPAGLAEIDMNDALCHVSFYEAAAYAAWTGARLPTEAEWEAAAHRFDWGRRWEWTNSAYLPYPGYSRAPGAVGEYNGKFMVNQMVLRGASEATPAGHSRRSYRNFFHPQHQWQFTGIRLAR